jgi:hypothetical protein
MLLVRKAVFAAMAVALAAVAALAAPAAAQVSYVPALGSPFATGAQTVALSVADADRNGTLDVAAGGLHLLRNDATGRLLNGATIASTGAVAGVAAGDLDGDGRIDFAAIAPGSPRRVVTLAASPFGGYLERTVLPDAGQATDLAVANVGGDGRLDIVVAHDAPDENVTVLTRVGDAYVDATYASGLPAPADVEVGDLDRDGLVDLAVAGGAAAVATLLNAGDGTFAAAGLQPAGSVGTVERITLAHLDGDGRLDFVATDSGGAPAVIASRGDGTGGIASRFRVATGLAAPPRAVAATDVDGDGRADVVAGGPAGRFALLLGNGAGAFESAPASPYVAAQPAAGAVDDLATVDMNHDGQPDVVTANRPGSVSVMLNSATGLLRPEPAELDFGELPAAASPVGTAVTLRSERGRLQITRVALDGTRAFTVDRSGCLGRTLLRGQACTVAVHYSPSRRAGLQRALLSVDANAAAVVVPLTGTPRAPLVQGAVVRPRKARAGGRLRLRYRISEDARVRFLLERGDVGRRAGRRCVMPRPANLDRRRCRMWTTVATRSRRGKAGLNVLRLRARANRRPLEPGLYRLSVSAADRFRNRSDERFAKFRVRPRAARNRRSR